MFIPATFLDMSISTLVRFFNVSLISSSFKSSFSSAYAVMNIVSDITLPTVFGLAVGKSPLNISLTFSIACLISVLILVICSFAASICAFAFFNIVSACFNGPLMASAISLESFLIEFKVLVTAFSDEVILLEIGSSIVS